MMLSKSSQGEKRSMATSKSAKPNAKKKYPPKLKPVFVSIFR